MVHGLLAKLRAVAATHRGGDRSTAGWPRRVAEHRPRHGLTPRESHPRPSTTRSTTRLDSGRDQYVVHQQLNQYHVILEADPKFQLNPQRLHDIYIQSAATSNTS